MSYTPTIGLEVHAELNTKSKMFCGCKNDPHAGESNAHICPVCMAHPGSLPVPNKQAIEMVLLFGRAVDATAANYSEFDRKNYFYPDIPKAYQISQYAFPFLTGGELEGVALTRVHLEEDTARSQHDKGEMSLVDFNRAGVPLMELVTEPVIHDAKSAGNFARELQLLLRSLHISEANMEKGEMRVEANISVSNSDTFGTKVEVKNLNSFKSVEAAIEFEIHRQITLLEAGKSVEQETRGWDETKNRTFSQRSKETAKDYRYFPDPDIPKYTLAEIDEFSDSVLDEKMPIIPSKKRVILENLGLPRNLVEVLITNQEIGYFFDQVLDLKVLSPKGIKLAVNYITSDVVACLAGGLSIASLNPNHFAELIVMLEKSEINSRTAKDLLVKLFKSNDGPQTIAQALGLLQQSDTTELLAVVTQVMADNPSVVAEYKAGKEASVQFLVGQSMKATKGAANPAVLLKLLQEALK